MAEPDSTSPIRVCTSCGLPKPATAEFFHASKRTADGRREVCRACRSAEFAANREKYSAQKKQRYLANRERIKAEVRAYYAKNAQAQKEAAKRRYWRNRDRNLARHREYMVANRDKVNATKRERSRQAFAERYRSDEFFTLRHRMRALLRRSLSSRNGRRLEELLGYTIPELRAHLERQFVGGMTWDRFMQGEIHVDHIIPVSVLRPTDVGSEEFRVCWALTNLRPVWAKDNLRKGAKIQSLL